MKKLLVISLAVVLVIGMSGVVGAGFEDSNMDEGLENSPAYEGEEGHWTHDNGAPRFDTDDGRIAIEPEVAGENTPDDSAVAPHDDDSIVKTNPDDDFGEQ